ncbi:MAG: efflux RND transporter periplasmic adaptor subunit [Acidobacteria bacterium]|nr:efflux RND transporter periplasmic adaptor subunit [Acidobacteriota bacterium]
MTRTPAYRAGLAVLVLAAAAACGQPPAEEVESESVVPVKVVPAANGSIRGVVHATGIVTPAAGAELVVLAPEPARIAEITRAEGDRVARGDVLVRFEIPSAMAEVDRQAAEVQRAQATVASAQAGRARAQALFDRGVAARRDVEDTTRAQADADAAQAQAQASLEAARAAASRAVVRATFDGVIAKRFHNPGDIVEAAAGDPVLRVVDPGRIEVVASIPLGDASRVVMGASARLAPARAGGGAAALRVVSRPTAVEPGTATVPIRLAFAGRAGLVVATPVEVDIEAERHEHVVLVPAAALVREGEETAVFVAAGDKAERRAVTIGLTDGMHVEIVSGIKAGESVIVDGQAGLPDGAAISIDAGGAP